jgi:anti-anti-sigma factor
VKKLSCKSRAQFFCKVSPDGARVVVEAHGEVDIGTVATLEELLAHVLDLRVPRLVLDVRPVIFLDLAGARVLLDAAARAQSSGTACTLVLKEGPVARLIRLLGAEIVAAPQRSPRCAGRRYRRATLRGRPRGGRRRDAG